MKDGIRPIRIPNPGVLACRDFRELWALRASQRNRYYRFVRCRVVGFWRDLFDSGDVFAFRGTD
jgi:hypothetical protein